MEQFLSPKNLESLYNSVQSTILTEKNIDIDSNSQFKSLIPKLAKQVYEKKTGLSLEELNEVCLKTVTIFFTNIIDKKLKKREESTEPFQDYGESTDPTDGNKDDDDFFEKLKNNINNFENEDTLLEPFQDSGNRNNNHRETYKEQKNPFIVVLDVMPLDENRDFTFWTINDEFKNRKCILNEKIELKTDCDIYMEFLLLNNAKIETPSIGNIESIHSFVLDIPELTGQKTISNNQLLSNNIIIPNDTYGYNDNAIGEDVGGANGGADGGIPPTGKLTSTTIKLKSNFICTQSPKTFSHFTVSLKGIPGPTQIPFDSPYLVAGSQEARFQVGLLFKPKST